MDINDQRDYSEENYNRAEMEREAREEWGYEDKRAQYCTEDNPVWVSGVNYVNSLDVESLYEELKTKGRRFYRYRIRCERCDKPYHPDFSFDPYA